MRAVDIIIKVRDRLELSEAEIQFFVQGITSGGIPDYQAAAWAMAVLLNGMTPRETTDLTLAMAHSGEPLFTLHARDRETLSQAREAIRNAHSWSEKPVQPLPLFYE